MRFNYRTLIVWLFIAVLAFVAISLSRMTDSAEITEINMTEFRQKVKNQEIKEVFIDGIEFSGILNDGKDTKFVAIGPSGERMSEFLAENNVPATYKKPEDDSLWKTLLISWLPMLIFVAIFIFFLRQMNGGNNKAFSFGKSKHRMISKDQNQIRFKDVARKSSRKLSISSKNRRFTLKSARRSLTAFFLWGLQEQVKLCSQKLLRVKPMFRFSS